VISKLKNKLNVKHKEEVLNLRNIGVGQRTIAQQCGEATPMVRNVNKNRNMTLKASEENCTKKGFEN
jgi:hypothetical protein